MPIGIAAAITTARSTAPNRLRDLLSSLRLAELEALTRIHSLPFDTTFIAIAIHNNKDVHTPRANEYRLGFRRRNRARESVESRMLLERNSGSREGCPARGRLAFPSSALAELVESVVLLFRFAFGAGSEFDVVKHLSEFGQREAVRGVGRICVAEGESFALL